MSQPIVVAHHFFRRTARARAARLNRELGPAASYRYTVTRAQRGPFRWYVVRVDESPPPKATRKR